MSGITVGLKNLHIATLTTDTPTAATYAAPVILARAIEAKITPSVNSTTLYADDGAAAVTSALGEVELELNIDALSTANQALLLGHTINADKVLVKKSTDIAPYVAVGFSSANDDGTQKYVWLLKGRFELPEQNFKTKGSEVEFQTPTIKAKFVKRDFDSAWQFQVDSGDSGVAAGVITGWFTTVYTPSA
jgi:phi13 family phage major tail protein